MKTIEIPSSVTSIDGYAFTQTGLESINIPKSVISIGEWCFMSDSQITSVTIPSSVETIGNYAFHDCSKISVLTLLMKSVQSFTRLRFYASTAYTHIYVPKDLADSYKSSYGWSTYASIIEGV